MKRRNFVAATAATLMFPITKKWHKDPVDMIWVDKYKRWYPYHKITFTDFEPIYLGGIDGRLHSCKLVERDNKNSIIFYEDYYCLVPLYKSTDETIDVVKTIEACCEDRGDLSPPTVLWFKYNELFGACVV